MEHGRSYQRSASPWPCAKCNARVRLRWLSAGAWVCTSCLEAGMTGAQRAGLRRSGDYKIEVN